MTNKETKQLIDPSEVEIKLSFTNYKLLKREEFNLKGSHIYFIKGPNETGKTSILQALRAAHEIKDDTFQKVTKGEVEGVNEFTIPGPEGKIFNVVYEFTDTSVKFVVYDEEGNKISKITDMRNIFKYNHVDATSFISWSRTAEGRRKQKEHILELLPPESYLKYKDFDTKETTLYDQRTKVNKDLEDNLRLQKEFELTSEEKEIQGNLKKAKEQLAKREEELKTLTESDNKLTEIINQMLQVESKINNSKSDHDVFVAKTEQQNKASENNITFYKNQILELQGKISVEENNIKTNNINIEKRQKEVDKLLAPDKTIFETLKKKREELKNNSKKTNEEVVSKLAVSVENGKNYVKRSEALTEKLTKFDAFKSKSDTFTQKSTELSLEIESARKTKEKIITEGEFPVENLSFDEEGYLTINGFRFDEHQTCESDTILIVAQLLCKMNITPIQILGDASLLDYNKLDKLYDIAEANGKIMFVDEIDRDLDKLVIVGYERKEKETKTKKESKPKKELF